MSPISESPASSLERHYCLLAQLHPEGSALHVPALLRVGGAFDLGAFARALAALVQRHSALRTTFLLRNGEVYRRVHASVPAVFATESQAVDEGAPEVTSELRMPFDLARGPLLRVRVWPARGGGFLVALTLHRIVGDATSKAQLMTELASDYARETGDAHAAANPPESTDYAAFAEAERAHLACPLARRAEDYFAAHLAHAPAALTLPTDTPRPQLASARGACMRFELPLVLAQKLESLGEQLHTKPFPLLVTAYAALLGHRARQERVTIGMAIANRRLPESHGTIGTFANLLPLHVDLGGEATFDALFARVKTAVLGHHRHQELPLERIVARTAPPADPSRHPIFQAGFGFEAPAKLALAGLDVQSLDVHAAGARLDLFMTVWERGESFCGQLEYCTDLFAPGTVERFVRGYLTLLEQATSEAARTLVVQRLPCLVSYDQDDVART